MEHFEVRFTSDDCSDFTAITAIDEEYAAEEFAEYAFYNRDGWEWMTRNRTDETITVKNKKDGKETVFGFGVEHEPCFHVNEIKPTPHGAKDE